MNTKQDFINGEFEDIEDENDRKLIKLLAQVCKRYFL